MSKSSRSLVGFCLALALTSAALANDDPPPPADTAAPPPAETTAAPPSETEDVAASDTAAEWQPETPVVAKAETDAASTTPSEELADDPIVCKRVEVTGSRLRKEKVCRKESEWRETSAAAQRLHRNIERKSSPGVGGQTLPPGG
ncbi:MAG: hypothetical protein ACRETT_04620 [Steroidobacteraceae bacterium]